MNNRPEILIGVDSTADEIAGHDIRALAAEAAFGIEEEGCLSRRYEMADRDDLRFSLAGVTLILGDSISLYCREAAHVVLVLRQKQLTESSARAAGHAAARFMKGLPVG